MNLKPVDLAREETAPVRNRAIAAWLAAALLFSGCAFGTGHVNITYQPIIVATRLAAPDSPRVIVKVMDKRATQTLGQKINGFGIETADLVADTDVPGTLEDAFETELHNRGFLKGRGGNVISVRLDTFENQFTIGFWSGEFVNQLTLGPWSDDSAAPIGMSAATIGMDVTVRHPNGSLAYNRYFTGDSKESIHIASENNAERTLDAAMQNGVSKVFIDSAFIDSLKKS